MTGKKSRSQQRFTSKNDTVSSITERLNSVSNRQEKKIVLNQKAVKALRRGTVSRPKTAYLMKTPLRKVHYDFHIKKVESEAEIHGTQQKVTTPIKETKNLAKYATNEDIFMSFISSEKSKTLLKSNIKNNLKNYGRRSHSRRQK